eukprot:m.74684 g.74684  ORF g.74684 m.74684 type:complete len:392 (-) comp20449_c0_seq1:135-1310(-)
MAFRRLTSQMMAFSNNNATKNENQVSAAPTNVKSFGGAKRSALGDIGNKMLGKKNDMKKTTLKTTKSTGASRPTLRESKPALSSRPVLSQKLDELAPMEMDKSSTITNDLPALALPPGVHDIDGIDADNPQLVVEYVNEIYSYMRDLETRHAVKNDYLNDGTQKDLTEKMRHILVDWLVEVHYRFRLLQETFYLGICILDRFLAIQPVRKDKLQLAGVTAFLIASKYEEMYPPEVGDFQYIADNAYSRADILAMEGHILKTLDYSLGTPLPLHFLRRYSKASGSDARIHTLAKYLMELSTNDYSMVTFLPSETACAALYMARDILKQGEPWNAQLEHFSGYKEEQFRECRESLTKVLVGSAKSKYQAIRKKFASKKLWNVSTLPETLAYGH